MLEIRVFQNLKRGGAMAVTPDSFAGNLFIIRDIGERVPPLGAPG